MTIEEIMNPLDQLSFLECDGLTKLISGILTKAHIDHDILVGQLRYNGLVVPLHLWIELNDGTIIDYRARMWLGPYKEIPHGFFSLQIIKMFII